jgi:hypothetical protein
MTLLFFSFGCCASAQKQTQPTLAETEKWIMQTFSTDSNSGRANCKEFNPAQPASEYGTSFYCEYESYVLDLKGCDATLTILYSHRTQADITSDQKEEKNTSVLSFNLRDIDPSSILSKEPTGSFGPLKKKTYHYNIAAVEVDFSTTDGADSMEVTFPHAPGPATPVKKHKCCDYFGSGIDLKPEYALRFVKAFRHAVELCGGKPSAF